jgi:hypothetical protein
MKRDDWMSLDDIYDLVAQRIPSTRDELAHRWRRNVRNVLQRRKAARDVEWNGHGAYRLV